MKKYFHQYIHIERGPVNSILVDFLKNKVYHIDNNTLDLFKQGSYSKISSFTRFAEKNQLIIKVENENIWIPYISFDRSIKPKEKFSIEIEIEDASFEKSAKKIFNFFSIIDIRCVKVSENQMQYCIERSKDMGLFDVNRRTYLFNMKFNSGWGQRIFISKKGKIKPCINSKIILGDIKSGEIENYINKIYQYWTITKDKIECCKKCEFRYCCFDCREIARLKGKNLYSKNPYCSYNPNKGIWDE